LADQKTEAILVLGNGVTLISTLKQCFKAVKFDDQSVLAWLENERDIASLCQTATSKRSSDPATCILGAARRGLTLAKDEIPFSNGWIVVDSNELVLARKTEDLE
jgi:hypothetical protein